MRFAALAFLLLIAGCGCVSAPVVPSHDALRATTHRLTILTAEGISICSATAIAADRLLTASHCVADVRALMVDADEVKVASVARDDDRATVTLSAPLFKAWAQLGPVPHEGDRVRWWGQPDGIPGVYREAVVARVEKTVIAVDAMVCHGDSGAGLFNAAGRVVAVMSRLAPDIAAPCVFGVAET